MSTKQATNCSQQVQKIKDKGFIVADDAACEAFFDQHNYYRVSAFLLPFRRKDKTYFKGVPFSRIQSIYFFDSDLRNLITKIIESIEMYCRTKFARQFTDAYGALGYMNGTNYASIHNHQKFLGYIQQYIQDNRKTPVVTHHMTNYGGDFPIWVMIEYFSLGTLSYFYSDMKTPDQKAIAFEFGTSVPCMKSWMRCITDLRNRCAHFSRLYYWAFPAVPRMPTGINYVSDHTLFSQIVMLSYLFPNRSEWNNELLPQLDNLLNKYLPNISLKHIGFPANWRVLLTR